MLCWVLFLYIHPQLWITRSVVSQIDDSAPALFRVCEAFMVHGSAWRGNEPPWSSQWCFGPHFSLRTGRRLLSPCGLLAEARRVETCRRNVPLVLRRFTMKKWRKLEILHAFNSCLDNPKDTCMRARVSLDHCFRWCDRQEPPSSEDRTRFFPTIWDGVQNRTWSARCS